MSSDYTRGLSAEDAAFVERKREELLALIYGEPVPTDEELAEMRAAAAAARLEIGRELRVMREGFRANSETERAAWASFLDLTGIPIGQAYEYLRIAGYIPNDVDFALRRPTPDREPRASSVYFIRAGVDGDIKIGVSTNVSTRLRMLQNAAPDELHLLGVFPGSYEDESALHMRFAQHRRRGEWFKPVPELLAFIAEKIGGGQ